MPFRDADFIVAGRAAIDASVRCRRSRLMLDIKGVM
jgi:hypothetical protein